MQQYVDLVDDESKTHLLDLHQKDTNKKH